MARASRAICWPWCAEICMPACFILPVSSRSRRFSALSRSQLASTKSERAPSILGQDFISITSNVIARAVARSHVLLMKEKLMTDIKQFVDRYINIWNEPDDTARRQTIRDLWQEDARHLARTLEAIGHAGIETRVKNAYDKWVKEKGNVFRLRDGVDGHHGTIKLRWEMLPAAGGETVSVGFDFLVLGDDGRIRTGYQFIEA